MLRWQRLNFLEHKFCNKFFIASLCLHIIGCFSLFFLYQDYHQKLSVAISKTVSVAAMVKVLPLSAPRSLLKKREGKRGKIKGKGASGKERQCVQKASTAFVKERGGVQKIKNKKKHLKKECVESIQKRREEVQKIVETKKIQKIIEEPQEASVALVAQGKQEEKNIMFVTQQEFDALQLQKKLQESLFDLWAAPVGIPATAVCEIVVTIGWDGKLLEKEMTKKTNILIYDLSVQEAVDSAIFPHEVWGKKVTLSFKP